VTGWKLSNWGQTLCNFTQCAKVIPSCAYRICIAGPPRPTQHHQFRIVCFKLRRRSGGCPLHNVHIRRVSPEGVLDSAHSIKRIAEGGIGFVKKAAFAVHAPTIGCQLNTSSVGSALLPQKMGSSNWCQTRRYT
jgi:hypothetical protein